MYENIQDIVGSWAVRKYPKPRTSLKPKIPCNTNMIGTPKSYKREGTYRYRYEYMEDSTCLEPSTQYNDLKCIYGQGVMFP